MSVAQPRPPAARCYSHPTQLTAQRSAHHRPMVSRARTRFKHTRAYPGRARPPPRHQSQLSRDLMLSGPRPHPTAPLPGSAPEAQAPPPGHDSEPPARVSPARLPNAHAQSCWPCFPPFASPTSPTAHTHLPWECCLCFCVSWPLFGERSRSRRRRESKKRRQEIDRKSGRNAEEKMGRQEEGRGETLKRLSEREGPVERRKSGAWWQWRQRTKEDEGV